ncbi:MAG: PIN domain-containing protein [Bifidobacteriaceae bacterium]|jgi:toxin-antitoxin system PIN domain toxin|nr:PIN domain-containing protein [Bifidobacteriaceae bacterium]
MRTDLPDVNVLVALFMAAHEHHDAAHRWLAGAARFATTPFTEAGLLRVLMTRTPVGDPLTGAQALDRLRELRELPGAVFWPDDTSLADLRAVTAHLYGPGQITGTHLLNLAIARGGRLATFDKGIAAPLSPKHRRNVLELG